MSIPTIPQPFYETVFNIIMLILGEIVIASAFLFIGRNEGNKERAVQRLRKEHIEKLKRVLNRMNVEDLEQYEDRS